MSIDRTENAPKEPFHIAAEPKVRVAVIGAGGISQVSHIPNLISEPGAEVVGVCDMDIGRAASVAQRFEVRSWFDDPEQMLKELQPDGVVVATPTISHSALCRLALESGADVLVEKPFAFDLEDARRLTAIAERTDRLLMVGMNHRFREDTTRLKKALEQGLLGELFMVRSGWLKRLGVWGRPYWFTDPKLAGGGVLFDLGLQMIDLIMFLLDFPAAVELNCGIGNHVLGLEVEDTASAFIRFEDDLTFLLSVSWAICHVQDIAYTYFDGSQGGASLNPLRISRRLRDRVIEDPAPRLFDEVELHRRSYRAEIAHFISCVLSRTEPLSSGRNALPAMEVVAKLYDAAER